jgi:hypothetical protein
MRAKTQSSEQATDRASEQIFKRPERTHSCTHARTHACMHTCPHTLTRARAFRHTHTHTRTNIRMHTHARAHTLTRAQTCARTHAHTRTLTHICTHTHTCAHAHASARTHTHARARTHTHTPVHTHTHAHTHARKHTHAHALTQVNIQLAVTREVEAELASLRARTSSRPHCFPRQPRSRCTRCTLVAVRMQRWPHAPTSRAGTCRCVSACQPHSLSLRAPASVRNSGMQRRCEQLAEILRAMGVSPHLNAERDGPSIVPHPEYAESPHERTAVGSSASASPAPISVVCELVGDADGGLEGRWGLADVVAKLNKERKRVVRNRQVRGVCVRARVCAGACVRVCARALG